MESKTTTLLPNVGFASPADVDIVGASDLEALAVLRSLAREYSVVELQISDCGCHRVELWVEGAKIAEEDKDLGMCVENLRKRINGTKTE